MLHKAMTIECVQLNRQKKKLYATRHTRMGGYTPSLIS